MRPTHRTWRPARSTGPALGLAITALALTCSLLLAAAFLATSSSTTRVMCGVGAATAVGIFLVAALGTWWCSTLRYALGPAALEVRYGSRLLRLRYDEIDEVTSRSDEDAGFVPTLWPGGHFGRSSSVSGGSVSGRMEVWRATTREPRHAVVVSAAGAGHVVTPGETESFRAELIRNAKSAIYVGSVGSQGVGSQGRVSGGSWMDSLASLDVWARALLLAAGVIATAGIVGDVARFGAAQRDGTRAALILALNALAALALSTRWPIVGRILAAGALAGQVLALF